MNAIVFKEGEIVVRIAKSSDIDEMGDLRESDRKEVWASNHLEGKTALRMSLKISLFVYTILLKDKPVAFFGICPETVTGHRAKIWLLATDEFKKIEFKFLKCCKSFINMFLEIYPYLDNYVYAENKRSVAWLRWCGARVQAEKPYGIEKELFHYFYFERKG